MLKERAKDISLVVELGRSCNSMCADCVMRGSVQKDHNMWRLISGESYPFLPLGDRHITFKQLRDLLESYPKAIAERIEAIRFAGLWCEPTLAEDLPRMVRWLLDFTREMKCELGVISNGFNLPEGPYNEQEMKDYFVRYYGFDPSLGCPDNFYLTISVDKYHLASFLKIRKCRGAEPIDAKHSYQEKIHNLIEFAIASGFGPQIIINTTVPDNVDPAVAIRNLRSKYNIADGILVHPLRLSIYCQSQAGLTHAVNLMGGTESPSKGARTVFLQKHSGMPFIFGTISDQASHTRPIPADRYLIDLL
ncbi:MAG: hypothetical protein WC686_02265 [Candidatus Shapirobacteria bacterium]|jgi:hypothetical protein